MKKLLFATFTFASVSASAQFSIKLYVHGSDNDVDNAIFRNASVFTTKTMPLNFLSIAARKEGKNKRYQEVELGRAYKSHQEGTFLTYTNNQLPPEEATLVYKSGGIKARYERGRTILFGTWKKRNCSFNLGHALQLKRGSTESVSTASNSFPLKTLRTNITYQIIPRFKMDLTKRWTTDINFAISTVTAGVYRQDIANFSLPENQRSYSIFDLDVAPQWRPISMRFGIGYKI